jgi:hypothetical protein
MEQAACRLLCKEAGKGRLNQALEDTNSTLTNLKSKRQLKIVASPSNIFWHPTSMLPLVKRSSFFLALLLFWGLELFSNY